MVKLHDLKPSEGSRRAGQRLGRGIAGKGGKTAGRGTKGQHSRGRGKVRVGFEGGQVPLYRRTPKLPGFKNPFRVEYEAVNLDTLSELGLSEVTPQILAKNGLISSEKALVKVLGRGEITTAVKVSAHAVSESAKSAIESSGGSVEVLDKPFKVRPAASGNQHMNR